jgi:hypothetical protein
MLTEGDGTQWHLSSPIGISSYLWLPLGILGIYPDGGVVDENHIRKMQLAISVLLEEPDDLNSALETELRLFRDKLHVMELESAIS